MHQNLLFNTLLHASLLVRQSHVVMRHFRRVLYVRQTGDAYAASGATSHLM